MNAHAFLGSIHREACREIETAKNWGDEDAAFTWQRGNLYVYGEVTPAGWQNVEVTTRSRSFRDFPALQAAVEDILPTWDSVDYDEEQAAESEQERIRDSHRHYVEQLRMEGVL